MRRLGLALLIATIATVPARAAEPATAMDLLRRLCIDTKAEPGAVKAAAAAAGFPPSTATPGGFDITSGKEITGLVFTGVGHVPDEPELGATTDDICELLVFPHANQAPEVLAWLGLAPDTPHPWTRFFVEKAGAAQVIDGRDGPVKRAAMAAGTLRLIKVERLQPEGLMIVYMKPRPDPRPRPRPTPAK